MATAAFRQPVANWFTGFILARTGRWSAVGEYDSAIGAQEDGLLGREPSVHDEFGAGYVGGLVAGKEENGVGHFLAVAGSFHGDVADRVSESADPPAMGGINPG